MVVHLRLMAEAGRHGRMSVRHFKEPFSVMGRGHSNHCEAAFNILPRFRAKSFPLHRLSYITLMNWGLRMSCVAKRDISPYVSLSANVASKT